MAFTVSCSGVSPNLCGPFHAGQLRILDLDLILKVLLCGVDVDGAVEVILEAALEGLVAALVIGAGIRYIDGRCNLCEQSNVVLAAQEVGNGIFGDYAVCQGPQPYYWGGTWICAAAGTDNIPTIKDVMYSLTCDADIMTKITEDT